MKMAAQAAFTAALMIGTLCLMLEYFDCLTR
jgi:hypothetical protein